MLKFVLIGIGLIAIAALVLWNLWNAVGLRIQGFSHGIKMLQEIEGYKDASIKIKEIKTERIKSLIIGSAGTLSAVLVVIFYFIMARHLFISNHEHVYGESVKKMSTCTEAGILQYKCRYCDEAYEEAIPVKSHSYVGLKRTNPTCTSKGLILSECLVCGSKKIEDFGAITHHQYVEITRREPTCVHRGAFVSVCQICGDILIGTIPLMDHQYEETSHTDPTSTERGTIVYTCTVCQDIKTETIWPAEHTYLEAEREEQSECDAHVSANGMEAQGHKWGEWHIIRDAEIVSRGERERTCLVCMASDQEKFLHPVLVPIVMVDAMLMIAAVIFLIVHNTHKKKWRRYGGKRERGTVAGGIVLIASSLVLCILLYTIFDTESISGTFDADIQQEQSTLVATKPVSIVRAEATSELVSGGDTNPVSYTFDGNVMTCWQDGADGDGEGEVLTYFFEYPCYIVGVDIMNGRVAMGEENYYENNRIRSMTLYYFRDGKVTASVLLEDMKDIYSREAEYYMLASEKKDEAYCCDGIHIVINSVYKGSVYDDLCLTEIQFYEGIYE